MRASAYSYCKVPVSGVALLCSLLSCVYRVLRFLSIPCEVAVLFKCTAYFAPAGVLSTGGSGESSGGDAGARALSLALLATIQAAVDAADAEAAAPLPAAVSAPGV